jgi:hypothetical protein
MVPLFDHEKLDVYGLELEFLAWITLFFDDVSQSSVQHRRELLSSLLLLLLVLVLVLVLEVQRTQNPESAKL